MNAHFLSTIPRHSTRLILAVSTASGCLFVASCGGQDASPTDIPSQIGGGTCPTDRADIFSQIAAAEVDADGSPESPEERRIVTRRRYVTVDTRALRAQAKAKGDTLRLSLFTDRTLDIRIDDWVDESGRGGFVASGHLADDPESEITLSTYGDVLVGTIHDRRRGESHEIRYLSSGMHTIETVQRGHGEDCETVEVPTTHGLSNPMDGDTRNDQDTPLASLPVVDMLVAYTPAARTKVGGTSAMLALIQMGIADTNTAFTNSGVRMRVRLAGTLALAQNETTSWSGDLSALRRNGDGRWDEVHAERARLGADQVTLIGAYINGSGTAGIGYVGATLSYAFAIVKSNAFGGYTFTHELGHNIGLNHSDGYENSSGRFRTVMAYGIQPRIRRLSNPELPYNGYRTGTDTKNSASIANGNATRMASLVPTASAPPSVPSPTPLPEEKGGEPESPREPVMCQNDSGTLSM